MTENIKLITMPRTKLCSWKKYWSLLGRQTISVSDLTELINTEKVSQQLKDGILFYKTSSHESFKELEKEHPKETKIITIVEQLQKLLKLDSYQTWDMMMHYLANEFHGNPETAHKNIYFLESKRNELLFDVSHFYNTERLFMLKILKLIIEFKNDQDHSYHKQFAKIINEIGVAELKSSLISQFEHLVCEAMPAKRENGELVNIQYQQQWAQRNLQEQLEILQIVLLIVAKEGLNDFEFKRLLKKFKQHNFSRHQSYNDSLEDRHRYLITRITHIEVAIFMTAIDDVRHKNIGNWINEVKKEVESELTRLQHNEEHGALLLAWMLLTLESKEHKELFSSHYQHFGTKALQLNVFEYLHSLVTNPMFADDSACATITRECVFELLCTMCNKFDADSSVSRQPYAFQLCSELISKEQIANQFWKLSEEEECNGVISMWNTALEYFPHDFKPLSTLSIGLAKAGKNSIEKLKELLENLPVFTEIYNPNVLVSKLIDSDDVIVVNEYRPYFNDSYEVKSGSYAAIMERKEGTFIHFRTPISYWVVLFNEMERVLDRRVHNGVDTNESLAKILQGVQVLKEMLRFFAIDGLPNQLVGPSEAVFDILVRYIRLDNPPMELLAMCLEMCTQLVPTFGDEIYMRLINTNLLPCISNTKLGFADYANGVSYDSATIGLYLVNLEQSLGEYKFLMAYLDMLYAFYECTCKTEVTTGILLPGLVFVLRDVFPHMSGWRYSSNAMRRHLMQKCIGYLFKILQLSPGMRRNDAEHVLYQTCIYSLLHIDNGVELLKIVSVGERHLQSVMEEETNWVDGPAMEYLRTIQISMAVLMQVLRLKNLVFETPGFSPMEHVIYTQPKQKDTLQIVPTVTGYMNHVFNRQIPTLACRLLKRFAMEFQMSLFACFDMSPHQIRTMFLERLRNKYEPVTLKTAILEFVATCVDKQPGLTEAFFNTLHTKPGTESDKTKEDEETESILSYMAEYLSAVKTNSVSLYSPLLSRIMGLFHALWKNNMQVLINDLRVNPKFWEYLVSPLFNDILPDIKAYSQIFNILGLELFIGRENIEQSLKDALETFFNTNNKHLDKWVKHIFAFEGREEDIVPIDEVPGWLSLLTSWKDFISVSMKCLPIPLNIAHKTKMVTPCLKVLLNEIEEMSDGRTVVLLSELYIIMLSNWKEDCFENKHITVKQIDELLNYAATVYECLHPRAKRAILSIATVAITTLDYEIKANDAVAQSIIRSVTNINSLELEKLCVEIEKANGKKQEEKKGNEPQLNPDIQTIVLALAMLEVCLDVYDEVFTGLIHWFQSTSFVNKLLVCLSKCMQSKAHYNTTLAGLKCLSAYARGPLSSDLLHTDVDQFLWLQLTPPKNMISHYNGNGQVDEGTWKMNEWWKIYGHGLDFISIMIKKHGPFFTGAAITFVGVHQDCLTEAILLPRQTLDMDVLELAASSLNLIVQLVKYEARWRREHFQSLAMLMRSISVCFYHSVTLSIRSRVIQKLVDNPVTPVQPDEQQNNTPSPKVAATLNKLLELIHMSSLCLLAFSPDLLSLLADPCLDLEKWQPLVEIHFGAPKISQEPFPQLTFGSLLASVCLLTKSLNHTYHCDDLNLSSSRSPRSRTPSRRRPCSCSSPGEGPSRRSVRSESVTSLSSTTSAIATGWLSAFDRRIVTTTLEVVLTLLASQALLAIKDPSVTSRDKQLVRRELSTELTVFHDFVKKRIMDFGQTKNSLIRMKMGIVALKRNEDEIKQLGEAREHRQDKDEDMENYDQQLPPPPPPKRSAHDTMRISVVRKLHLDKRRTSTPAKKGIPATEKFSPILPLSDHSHSSSSSVITSTPSGSEKKSKDISRSSKKVSWAETTEEDEEVDEEEDEIALQDEPAYSTLTEVHLVDEDYFHFLSNIFLFICQTES